MRMKLFDRLVMITTLIGVIMVSIIICFLHNTVEEVKTYNTNRVEALMADSVKMHEWYENLSRTSCRLEKR